MSEKQEQNPYPYNEAYTPQPVAVQPVQYYSAPVQPVGVQPSDYLILSIFTLVCCFWPVGIIALIKSVETRNHWQSGRYVEAKTTSEEAKKFNMLGIILGIVINVIVWVIVIVSVAVPLAAVFGTLGSFRG